MPKRDDIIKAAVLEFGEYSYDAASINRIIKASGTSKGTFYHYFRNKKELYFSIIENAIRIKQEYFSIILELVKRGDNFFDILKAQAKQAAVFMRENPDLYQFGLQFNKELNPVKNEFMEKYIPGLSDSYMKIIEVGIAGNHFTQRYPPDFTAKMIGYLSFNYYDILFEKGAPPTPEELEQALDMLFDFMQRGLT